MSPGLCDNLLEALPADVTDGFPRFPAKAVIGFLSMTFGASDAAMELRRQQIEGWLKHVITRPEVTGDRALYWKDFSRALTHLLRSSAAQQLSLTRSLARSLARTHARTHVRSRAVPR